MHEHPDLELTRQPLHKLKMRPIPETGSLEDHDLGLIESDLVHHETPLDLARQMFPIPASRGAIRRIVAHL